jgi:hypothetical protein
MRVSISLTPDPLGPRGVIVEDTTADEIAEWLRLSRDEPDTVLEIPGAKVHVGIDITGTASIRAGRITGVRPI